MDVAIVRTLLQDVSTGAVTPDAAIEALRDLPFEDLGFAKVDHHRALRQGFPEVIFCQGKTPSQVAAIAARIQEAGATLLGTRADEAAFAAVQQVLPQAEYRAVGRIIYAPGLYPPHLQGQVGVLCAGTSDIPVAEEAACTLDAMGAQVERIYDVGVAGLHRLLHYRDTMRQCAALIAVAGMEGAMPTVAAGLVDVPVIAVPTSIGYGAAFGGLAALLGMLNSCANGVAVVNIDNGFGAAAFAASILRSREIAAASADTGHPGHNGEATSS
ncbi:MAG: nickel pincer cofactor biosynthesis protein LarB [Abitibacteriaceae bacterium]|nr:nickel pincer cofactor biosynthesis protein LarB [Abditibacteriaceae bacterium]